MLAVDTGDASVAEAVRTATLLAGLDAPADPSELRGTWWRAGLREALDRGALEPAAPRYGATPPPRRTRGATRA